MPKRLRALQLYEAKVAKYDDDDDVLPKPLIPEFVDMIFDCVQFIIKHHNADEHIKTYASNICAHGIRDVRDAFFLWLAEMQEVD